VWCGEMFSEKYTTSDKIQKEKDDDTIVVKVENKKTILTNDAMAIGELLELLINTTRNK
jgi:hypothetical protein